MSSINLADASNFEFPNLQKELIPSDSVYVRRAMHEAAVWSMEEDPFSSRAVSVAFAAGAVALSAINTVVYLLATPVKLILNIVQLDPAQLMKDLALGPLNAVRSFVFVALGLTFVALGVIIPKTIFSCFDPEFVGTENDRLRDENARLKEEKAELEKKLEELARLNQSQGDEIFKLKNKKWRLF